MTELTRYYHDLADNLREISRRYYYDGRLQDAVDVLKHGIDACRPADLAREDEAALWVDYGKHITYGIMQLNYTLEDALPILDKAIALSKQIGDRFMEAACLTQYGRAHYYGHFADREFEQATDYLRQARDLQQAIDDKRGLSESVLFLGLIQQFSGNRDEAVRLFQDAYDVAEGYPLEQSYAILHIGMLELHAEQWQSALENITESLYLRESVGFKQGLPFPHIFAGDALAALSNVEAAREHYEQAQALAREINNQRALLFATLSLGIMYHDQQDSSRAKPFLHDAKQLAETMGHERGIEMAEERLASLPD